MIDAELLRSLGWSDELIRSAAEVSRTVTAAAVETSVTVDFTEMSATVAGSQRADVSGPPVAQPELRIEVK